MSDEHENETAKMIAATIDAAEVVRDPLEGLIKRTAIDPGAAFAPAVLERLAALQKEDLAAFEVLRSQLKKAGCRVTALDVAMKEGSGETGGRGPSQADVLIGLAQSAELFHAPDDTGLRRPCHQGSQGDLADPQQGIPPLVGSFLFRGDGRRAKFGNLAVGIECHRGQGTF